MITPGIIIVIPCFNEPALTATLESLWLCQRPECAVEVLVIVNASESSPESVQRQNQVSIDSATDWINAHSDPLLHFTLRHYPALPHKHAGVGLARKLGMDEAAERFHQFNRPEGVILCLDADCTCQPNYLVSVEQHFRDHPDTPGCSIHFEHPLSGPLPAEIYHAITLYELHLRYYIEGLKFAGCPHAFQTVGSSMAVRARVYRQQGGMNKRKAGEDFYFLHKIIELGQFTNLTQTCVIPSPRISDRVPFGTGKAVADFLKTGSLHSYPLQAFLDLREFFVQIHQTQLLSDSIAWQSRLRLSPALASFLALQFFSTALVEITANTNTPASFQKRFFRWFNAFRAMKFIHHARDHFYGNSPIASAAASLAQLLGQPVPQPPDALPLLHLYRALALGAPGSAGIPAGHTTSNFLACPQRFIGA